MNGLPKKLVRDLLAKLGYFDNSDIIVEEQQSSFAVINKLLKNASKKGNAQGRPEFIIRSKANSNFVIVIECKAETKRHQSSNLDKYADYAVDGAILYASFLAKEYDVLAIGISGQTKSELTISHYIIPKGDREPVKYFGNSILSFDDYVSGFAKSDIKFNQDYDKLLSYTKELNSLLHKYKIKESQRSLLISGILVSLENDAFRSGYATHKKAEQVCASLVHTIADELANASIPAEKRTFLTQAFSFISTNTTLTEDKDFVIDLIKRIDENVYQFIKTYKYFDTLGQFYVEFLRYANNDKGLGIVLTPPHITELFCDLAAVDKDSIVFDNCCGTGGFLVSAMKRMVESAKSDKKKILEIKQKQLIGIEYQDDIFALGVSNAILHGDGKTGLLRGDCFKLVDEIKKEFKPNIGFLNPPYKSKDANIEEWDFVLNNLEVLEKGGTCVAIIPASCVVDVTGNVLELKKKVLQQHTLLAVMSMPEELFHNSKVSVPTCIVIIKAHIPHPAHQKTWLAYWREDGFEKTKDRGRIDLHRQWSERKQQWLTAFLNREQGKDSTMQKVLAKDEWCAEANLLPDYSQITKETITLDAKKYLAYRLLYELLNVDLTSIKSPYRYKNNLVELDQLFDVYNGLASSNVEVKDEAEIASDIRYIRPSQSYSGSIAGYVDRETVNEKFIYPDGTLYVSTDGQGSHSFSYVSSFNFVPNSNVSVLIPKRPMGIQEKLYYAACVTMNRFKFSYGRKPKGERLKKLLIPEFPPDFVFDGIFDDIVKSWQRLIKK